MKNLFLFDNEPISGVDYLLRRFIAYVIYLVSSYFIVIFVLLGVWIDAATIYKRAGSFKWGKDFRIICSISIPLVLIINSAGVLPDNNGILSLMILVNLVLNFIFIFKDGNRDLISSCDECGIKVEPGIKYCDKCEINNRN